MTSPLSVGPLSVGIVGYGWAAGAHIDAINSSKLGRVTSVCSSRKLNEQELSRKHGVELKVFNDLNVLLADPTVDVVDICSYHAQHAGQIIAAAKAGKHIIVEKPIALSLEDLRAIEAAVRGAGVNFCVCFELRFSSQFLQTRQLIDNGALGKLHYGEIDYYHAVGPWYREYEWVRTKEACGSSLLTAGCHAMDALLLCFPDEVQEVFCSGTQSANPIFAAYDYPSTTVTVLRFKDGGLGKCTSCIDCLQPYYFHTHLIGSDGVLLDNKIQTHQDKATDHSHWRELPFKPVDSGDVSDHPYRAQFESFFSAIRKNEPMPLTGLGEALRTHEVIFAAERSMRERRPVSLSELKQPTIQ